MYKKPLYRPVPPRKERSGKVRRLSIEKGFHSLVQILLEGGAIIADERYNALQHAVSKKRLDIVELFVSHGADVKSIEMYNVFDTWDPNIMEYFIAHGADLEPAIP